MLEIEVNAERSYKVAIGAKWRDELNSITSNFQKVALIAPEFLVEHYQLSHENLFIVPDGESQKSYATIESIWEFLGERGIGRKDAIVGIGGGATTDLAGFAAATWLRGVEWFAFPTSLAAMVDASVGGKTGINTGSGKNLVGSFYSPSRVVIDREFLNSLSERDYAAGLAEVIKTGLISDGLILELLDSHPTVAQARTVEEELIARSVSVKARVVSADFTEGKLREILNFGHTFGHAVEKDSGYTLRHGEAVAVGLHFALLLSEELSSLDKAVVDRSVALLAGLGLPIHYEGDFDLFMRLMQGDKKSRSGKMRFIGIASIGEPVWYEEVNAEILQSVYERMRS